MIRQCSQLYQQYLIDHPLDEIKSAIGLLGRDLYYDFICDQYYRVKKFMMWHDMVFSDVFEDVSSYQDKNKRFKKKMPAAERRELLRLSKVKGKKKEEETVCCCLSQIKSDTLSSEETMLFHLVNSKLKGLIVYKGAGFRNCMVDVLEIASVINRGDCQYYGAGELLAEIKSNPFFLVQAEKPHEHNTLCQNQWTLSDQELVKCCDILNTNIGIHYFEGEDYRYEEVKKSGVELQGFLHMAIVKKGQKTFIAPLIKEKTE